MPQNNQTQNINHESETTTDEIMVFLKDNMVMRSEFDELKKDVIELKNDVSGLKNQMVTKTYLDDKLADLAAESGDRLNRHIQQDQCFKQELITDLGAHSLLDEPELKRLEKFV